MSEAAVDIDRLPAVTCKNCMGENLGFEASTDQKTPNARPFPVIYQGCNDCSETLWVGSFEEFLVFLDFVYEMTVPRLD